MRDERLKGLSTNDIINSGLGKFMNIQIKMLGWRGEKSRQKVYENIDRIDVIGLLDHFDDSIACVNQNFGWKLENISPQNVSPKVDDKNFNREVLEILNEKLKIEIEIYEIIKNKFSDQLRIIR